MVNQAQEAQSQERTLVDARTDTDVQIVRYRCPSNTSPVYAGTTRTC